MNQDERKNLVSSLHLYASQTLWLLVQLIFWLFPIIRNWATPLAIKKFCIHSRSLPVTSRAHISSFKSGTENRQRNARETVAKHHSVRPSPMEKRQRVKGN